MSRRENGDERSEELGEGHGQGRQTAAHDETEKGPAEQKSRSRAVGLA